MLMSRRKSGRSTVVAGTPIGFTVLPSNSLAQRSGSSPRQQRQSTGPLAVGSPESRSDSHHCGQPSVSQEVAEGIL